MDKDKVCTFIKGESSTSSSNAHDHDHDHHSHSHEHGGHGHTHEQLEHPGLYLPKMNSDSLLKGRFAERDPMLSKRNWKERAFTIGIGGPVGRLEQTSLRIYFSVAKQHCFCNSVVTFVTNTTSLL